MYQTKQFKSVALAYACFAAFLASSHAALAQLAAGDFSAATAVPPVAFQSSSGTPSSTTVYYGDGHWAAPTAASASVSTDYIFGLGLSYSSSGSYGSVVVATGTCYCPSASAGNIIVTNAGTSTFNGTYSPVSQTAFALNGSSASGNPWLQWNGSNWVFILNATDGVPRYTSSGSQTLASGPVGSYTTNTQGVSPSPTVAAGTTVAAGVYTLSSAYTYTLSSALTGSTFYFVYLNDAGTFTISTTTPALYQGTARSSTAGRYIGCFLTTSTGTITNFQQIGDRTRYRVNTAAAPFRVVSASAVTTATTQSCSAVVPPTATMATCWLYNGGSTTVYIGTSDGVAPTTTTGETEVTMTQTEDISLDSSQSFSYIGGTLTADIEGFIERR